MTRRIAISVSFVAVTLMACCCGGAGNQRPAAKAEQKQAGADDAPAKAAAQKQVEETDKRLKELREEANRRPIPAVHIDGPIPRQFAPVTHCDIGGVKIEIKGGSIGKLAYMTKVGMRFAESKTPSEMLILNIGITNNSGSPIKYTPWYAGSPKSIAKDELAKSYGSWSVAPGGWPVGHTQTVSTIAKTHSDMVAFDAPDWRAEEIDVFLAGSHVGQPGKTFAFKIGRAVVQSAEVRKAAVASEVGKLKAAEESRLNKLEDARIAAVKSQIRDIEMARQAKIAEANRIAEEKRLAEEKAAEAKLPKVSRRNYNKIQNGMTLREVQAILGPGKEGARSGDIVIATWESGGFSPVIISITFHGGTVESKAIIGD